MVTGVDFVSIPTRDFSAAARFYGDVLGLRLSKRYDRVPGGEFETGTVTLQLIETEAIGRGFYANLNPVALRVDDVAAARGELESQDVVFQHDTIDTGVCHMAVFADPDGNLLMLHHRYAAPDVN
ncbi:MAG TPA: VOC family protein [Solirubrobacteraceae bacterium]|nr:VOC family protein [Solirubrobacteraceae bacterium]